MLNRGIPVKIRDVENLLPPIFSEMSPQGALIVHSLHQQDTKAIPYGYAIVTLSDKNERAALLWMIYTREPYRRQGHASTLLSYLQTRYDSILTHYETLNSPGSALCLKAGFVAKRSMFKNAPNELVWNKRKQ